MLTLHVWLTCPEDVHTLRIGCQSRLVMEADWILLGTSVRAAQSRKYFWKMKLNYDIVSHNVNIHFAPLCTILIMVWKHTCLILTVSRLFLTELYNSPRGYSLYFRSNHREECCSSCSEGFLTVTLSESTRKRG